MKASWDQGEKKTNDDLLTQSNGLLKTVTAARIQNSCVFVGKVQRVQKCNRLALGLLLKLAKTNFIRSKPVYSLGIDLKWKGRILQKKYAPQLSCAKILKLNLNGLKGFLNF